jgi:hypothetical protein
MKNSIDEEHAVEFSIKAAAPEKLKGRMRRGAGIRFGEAFGRRASARSRQQGQDLRNSQGLAISTRSRVRP